MALAKEALHSILLLELRFASGTVYLSNETVPFIDPEWAHTWQGLGNWVGMSDIEGGPDDLAPVREYYLGIPWELLTGGEIGVNGLGTLPALVSDRAEYVNRAALLWDQVLSDDTLDTHGRPTPIGIPSALHFGLMDQVRVDFSRSAARLVLTVEGPLARKGAPVFGRLTDRDQKRRHPTPTPDKGLRYVPEVLSTNVRWTDW